MLFSFLLVAELAVLGIGEWIALNEMLTFSRFGIYSRMIFAVQGCYENGTSKVDRVPSIRCTVG